MSGKPTTPDAYTASLPSEGQEAADAVRRAIHDAVPGATETIKYGMLAFQTDGRTFVYVGVWKKHVGLYPIYSGDLAFEAAVGPYRAKTDTLQFPLREAMPLDLIGQIARRQAARRDL